MKSTRELILYKNPEEEETGLFAGMTGIIEHSREKDVENLTEQEQRG